jgi:hypothetical protein
MRAGNGCSHSLKGHVTWLVDWITTERQNNRRLMISRPRRRPRRRPMRRLTRTLFLIAPVKILPVMATAVVLLSAAALLAPMWDRAIFAKSLLKALNTNPALLQGL